MSKGSLRRTQIIETAERLFCKNGYEQTSVQDVIDAIGYSKGGFYHHFDSKIALLDAICEARSVKTRETVEAAVKAANQNPVDRLNAFFEASGMFQEDSLDYISLLLRVAYRGDASLMRDKLKEYSLMATLPALNEIIMRGARERVFFVPHADLAGEMILRLVAQFADDVAFKLYHLICDVPDAKKSAAAAASVDEELLPLLLDKLVLYRHAVERILEAPFGSVQLYNLRSLANIVRALLSKA